MPTKEEIEAAKKLLADAEAETQKGEDLSKAGQQKAETKEGEGITLTQEKLDELINKAFARGAKNSKEAKEAQKTADELAQLKGQMDYLNEVAKTQKKTGSQGAGQDDEALQQAQQKIEQMSQEFSQKMATLQEEREAEAERNREQQTKLREQELRTAVFSAASRANAADPEEVLVLMQHKKLFQHSDDDGWQTFNDKGQLRIDVEAGGDNMSIDKSVAEYINQNPRLQKGTGRTGSGQPGTQKSGGREVPLPDGLPTDRAATPSEIYAQRKQVVKHVQAGGEVTGTGKANQA